MLLSPSYRLNKFPSKRCEEVSEPFIQLEQMERVPFVACFFTAVVATDFCLPVHCWTDLKAVGSYLRVSKCELRIGLSIAASVEA